MAKERVARAMFEKDEIMKILEEGKAKLKVDEESIRKNAYDVARKDATSEILKYEMSFRRSTIFRCSAIFMTKQKYLVDGSKSIRDLNVERSPSEIDVD